MVSSYSAGQYTCINGAAHAPRYQIVGSYLKETIRFSAKYSKQHRSLARRIQLLAEAPPADSRHPDYQVALLALDIAATRENIPLQLGHAAWHAIKRR
ncbi:hypothetical protein [Vreelandella populi]|uniref:hypothetical protein n=1 Tax=Vreelandella populi TaxID=2498858 RepID=UPI000F8F3AC9|nr:hypothetical protein [Halomonas populi]RUR56357.1 hypothetical protein ELY40_04150 [Halomonas populi]